MIGRKVVDSIISEYQRTIGSLPSQQDRKTLEMMILGDDIFSDVATYAKRLSPKLMSLAAPVLKTIFP